MTQATAGSMNLVDRVIDCIQSRAHGRVRDLAVEILGQSVVLRGRVTSYYMKQLALHGALDAVTDGEVINEIQVV